MTAGCGVVVLNACEQLPCHALPLWLPRWQGKNGDGEGYAGESEAGNGQNPFKKQFMPTL